MDATDGVLEIFILVFQEVVCLFVFFTFYFLFFPYWKFQEVKPEVKVHLTNELLNVLSPDSRSQSKEGFNLGCM